jgi:hypothetical protein
LRDGYDDVIQGLKSGTPNLPVAKVSQVQNAGNDWHSSLVNFIAAIKSDITCKAEAAADNSSNETQVCE